MDKTTSVSDSFLNFAGEMAESLSVNRSLGQIYALLYIAPEPLSLSEIAERLSMSKGNASVNLRVLESWGAVRPVTIPRTRRDHYEADRDLKKIALRRIEEGVGRRLEGAEERLDRLVEDVPKSGASGDERLRDGLEELRSLVRRVRRALRMAPRLASYFLR